MIAVAEASHLVGLGLSTRLHEHASALVLESTSDPRGDDVSDLLRLSEEHSPKLMHNNLELNYKAFEPLTKQTPDREVTLILSGMSSFVSTTSSMFGAWQNLPLKYFHIIGFSFNDGHISTSFPRFPSNMF